jgi:hypothetical protein
VVAGKATENDTGAPAAQPQDGGTAQGWAPGAPKLSITGRQIEILLSGLDGKTLYWAWALEMILFSLPASAPGASPQAGAAPAKSGRGSQAASATAKAPGGGS